MNIKTQQDLAILRKSKEALKHKDQVARIRACHEELFEAEIRLIEAVNDVEDLKERNSGIVQQLAGERELAQNAETESRTFKDIARQALQKVKEISDQVRDTEDNEHFQTIPLDTTVESLENDIAAEEAKLNFIHASDPNAKRNFEEWQTKADKLKEKIVESERKLERTGHRITKVRDRWEPGLDRLIVEISDAFSYNFEQIGCAGEVSVHKDDDFDLWAIQIKVKFRYAVPPL